MKHDLMRANQALHRRHAAKYLLETFRALGMTDEEIRAALTAAQTPAPTTPPASEPISGQPSGEAVQAGGARGASESSTRTE